MALLKSTTVNGNIVVEGNILAKEVFNLDDTSGGDSEALFPRFEIASKDYIIKFEDDTSKIAASQSTTISPDFNLTPTTVNFKLRKVDINNENISFNKLSKTAARNQKLYNLYKSNPRRGDLFIEVNNIYYSTNFSVEKGIFTYDFDVDESIIGGIWSGIDNNCHYPGTWPAGKIGIAIHDSYLLDSTGNDLLQWDGSYQTGKLGPNDKQYIGDGISNSTLYTSLIGTKEDSIFHWLDLFNKNTHPFMINDTGYNDWFIPSYYELLYITENCLNPIDNYNYWTSEEHTSYDTAWLFSSNKTRDPLAKASTARVIIARYFSENETPIYDPNYVGYGEDLIGYQEDILGY